MHIPHLAGTMRKPSGFDGIVEILKNPGYRNYTIGSSFSLVGTWVHRVAAGWLTWQLSESGAWLGIIAFADLFTMVLFSPFAGAIADRVDRLWLFKLFQLNIQPFNKDSDLLPKSCWRSWLTMGSGQHWNIIPSCS